MPKKAKKPAPKKNNHPLARLKAAATKKNGNGNGQRVPVIDDVPAEIRQLVDEYVEANLRAKEAKSAEEMVADALRPRLYRLIEELFERGEFRNSIKVEGSRHTLMFVVQDKFSYLTEEALPAAKKLLGKQFDQLVEPEVTMRLRPEIVRDEQKLEELMELLGDRLEEFFEVEMRYKPRRGFLQKIYALFPKARVEKIRRLFRHATPHLRVV